MTGLRGNPLHWGGRERVTPAPTEFRPRKRVTGAERWRLVAAASAVVGRGPVSPPPCLPLVGLLGGCSEGGAAPARRGGWTTRLPAFRFLFCLTSMIEPKAGATAGQV